MPNLIQTYAIEPLAKKHDCSGFDCGTPELNDYLQKRAGQDARRTVASVWVAVHTKTLKTAGYFTLSMAAIPLENLADTVNCPGMAMLQRSTLDKRELRWIQLSMPFSEALQQRRSCINIHPFY